MKITMITMKIMIEAESATIHYNLLQSKSSISRTAPLVGVCYWRRWNSGRSAG